MTFLVETFKVSFHWGVKGKYKLKTREPISFTFCKKEIHRWAPAPPRDTGAALETAGTRGDTCHVHFIKYDRHLLPLSLP